MGPELLAPAVGLLGTLRFAKKFGSKQFFGKKNVWVKKSLSQKICHENFFGKKENFGQKISFLAIFCHDQ